MIRAVMASRARQNAFLCSRGPTHIETDCKSTEKYIQDKTNHLLFSSRTAFIDLHSAKRM